MPKVKPKTNKKPSSHSPLAPTKLLSSYRLTSRTIVSILVIALLAGAVFIYLSKAAAVPGDTNSDNKVDISDLSIVLSNYGKSTSTGDVSSPPDGKVDISDLSIVLSNYGRTVPPPPTPPPPPSTVTCTKTLAAGGNVQTFVNSLASGQTGCLRGGTYSGAFSINNSGVTLTSSPGEKATINISDQIELRGANVTMSRLKIVGGGGSITLRVYGDNDVVEGNDITNNHQGISCVIVGGSDILTHSSVIRGNVIHGCGGINNTHDQGIYASHFVDITIIDNVFYDIAAYSIQLYPEGTRARVSHNVIDGGGVSVRGGIVIDGDTALNHIIERNIIAYSPYPALIAKTGSGHQFNNNCVFQNGGVVSGGGVAQTGNITADPLFVGRSNGNYRLAANSPCLSVVQYDTAAKIGF